MFSVRAIICQSSKVVKLCVHVSYQQANYFLFVWGLDHILHILTGEVIIHTYYRHYKSFFSAGPPCSVNWSYLSCYCGHSRTVSSWVPVIAHHRSEAIVVRLRVMSPRSVTLQVYVFATVWKTSCFHIQKIQVCLMMTLMRCLKVVSRSTTLSCLEWGNVRW